MTEKKLHPSIQKIHDVSGSGYYHFSRFGFGGICYISSTKVTMYNTEVVRASDSITHYDIYDVIRAVETGFIEKLGSDDYAFMNGKIHRRPSKDFCNECSGPYPEDSWPGDQYSGHWDTCPNRVQNPEYFANSDHKNVEGNL